MARQVKEFRHIKIRYLSTEILFATYDYTQK
jgi:hypothetical protein